MQVEAELFSQDEFYTLKEEVQIITEGEVELTVERQILINT